MSQYRLNFHPIDPAVAWQCQAPRHGRPSNAPRAVSLALFLVASALKQNTVLVHQATYVCEACQARMQADLVT